VHQRPAELGLRCVMRVEVDRIGVHGEEREPGVVGGRDGAAERVGDDEPGLEVFKVASAHASFFLSRVTCAMRMLAASIMRPSRLTAPRPAAPAASSAATIRSACATSSAVGLKIPFAAASCAG